MGQNNKANVSTTRGVKGGYFFSAPIGTTDIPTAANYKTWTPGTAWENQGYVPEDGFTESASMDGGENLKDINQDIVDTTDTSVTETLNIGFMEIAKAPLSTQYGHENVTDEGGTITVDHNWGKAGEHRMYVLLLLLKNGRRWVKFIPDAKVTGLEDLTGNKTTIATRKATLTYLTDENGSGCIDYIESTETPAPQLSTLSLGTLTLSPTFAATTRAYAVEATAATSETVTATVATGNTLAIKDANGNSYSSGDSIPLVTGTNVITLEVTHTETGAVGTYVITITNGAS